MNAPYRTARAAVETLKKRNSLRIWASTCAADRYSNWNQTEVSVKDIRRDALGQSVDAQQTIDLLNNLGKAGWLRKGMIETGGRARRRWEVNPKLFVVGNAGSAANAEG
jgi:hypothetical protein